MHLTDARFAALLAIFAATGSLAADGGVKNPGPGASTSDGFTVSAQWHVHYTYRGVIHGRAMKSEAAFMGVPLTQDTTSTTAAEVDVNEEVNKKTGKTRIVLQSGEWHWEGRDTRRGSLSAHGSFDKSPRIEHWIDENTKQTMVSFSVQSLEPTNLDELQKAHWWGGNALGSLGCDQPYDPNYFVFRQKDGGSGGLAGGQAGNWSSELIITRSVQKLEAEIRAGPEFKNWVPTMTGVIPFQVRMIEPPDLPVQWKVSLYKTSKLPGVCNNANITDFPDLNAQWQNGVSDSYDLIFDFRRYGKIDSSFKPVDEPWQVLETSKPATGANFAVNSLDYGASGRVKAVAEFEGQPCAAIYKETGEPFVRIPYSTSKDDSHRIAQAAKPSGSEETYDKFSGGKPDADDDDYPEGRESCIGDGLTLFEEYRGFFLRSTFDPYAANVHRRLNPKFKDVFIFMDADTALLLSPYLADFQKASGLAVHRIGDDGPDDFLEYWSRVVNFNRGDIGADQRALRLDNFNLAKEGVIGECAPDLGPPTRVNSVCVSVDKIEDVMRHEKGNFRDYIKQVTIHELGHAVGIAHHGENDDLHNPFRGEVAMEKGQHSGDIECAMRYVGADFYLHNSSTEDHDPQYHRYNNNLEHLGLDFCSSKKGTGLNDKSKSNWYCGDASAGNCKAQIVVNDKCAGDGGGSGQDRAGPGQGGSGAPPADPAEKSARRSQSEAHVSAKLSAGGKQTRALIPGEALVFELKLTGLPNASLDLGNPGEPWTKQIALKTLDANGKLVPLPAIVRPIGKPMQTDYNDADSGTPPSEKPAPGQIKIAPKNVYRVSLAIDGAETAKLPAGELRVFAAFAGQPLVSSSVQIKVRKANDLSADEQAHADSIRALSEARLAYADEKFTDAERFAREVIAKIPILVEAHLILARSLEKQNKLREAYDAYGKALQSQPPPRNPKVEEPPLEIIFALRELREKLGIQLEPPPEAAAGPFTAHALFAEIGGGANKLNAPFPVKPDRLVFEWQMVKAADDPIGVRWIAADTNGAAPADQEIATSQSQTGATKGQFTLKAPDAGFPPGKYRLEIWQSGKEIYAEPFEVKR